MPKEIKHVFYPAQTDVLIDRMNSIGPGDEDVNTQSGRSTTVTVKSSAPRPAYGSTEVVVTLEYKVREGRKDNTTLYAKEVVTIQLENGARFVEFGGGYTDADYKEVIGGEQHDWFDITNRSGIRGSVLQWCNIKIDGKGDDDNGNAQLSGHLSIPLVVEIEVESPSSGGTTSDGTTQGSSILVPKSIPGWLSQTELSASTNPALTGLLVGATNSSVKVSKSYAGSRAARLREPV